MFTGDCLSVKQPIRHDWPVRNYLGNNSFPPYTCMHFQFLTLPLDALPCSNSTTKIMVLTNVHHLCQAFPAQFPTFPTVYPFSVGLLPTYLVSMGQILPVQGFVQSPPCYFPFQAIYLLCLQLLLKVLIILLVKDECVDNSLKYLSKSSMSMTKKYQHIVTCVFFSEPIDISYHSKT